MMRFAQFFPEIAKRELRTLILKEDAFEFGKLILPRGDYGFDELYCAEAGCDCRRVVLNVWADKPLRQVATINHSFERPRRDAIVSKQTFLDPINPQSRWSEPILELFENVVLDAM